MPKIVLTDLAHEVIAALAAGKTADPRKLKRVGKALAGLEMDPHYPGLQSHRFEALDSEFDERIWESYVENHSPEAWRMWWYFGPDGTITVVHIGPHP